MNPRQNKNLLGIRQVKLTDKQPQVQKPEQINIVMANACVGYKCL
jgi:hypothetical protein